MFNADFILVSPCFEYQEPGFRPDLAAVTSMRSISGCREKRRGCGRFGRRRSNNLRLGEEIGGLREKSRLGTDALETSCPVTYAVVRGRACA